MFHLITIITTFGKIEAEIKRLEKSFSRKDFRDFEDKFNKDFSSKQYDLESAKVYETATNQITIKKQKFNSVSQKLINDYGRKYEEISSKDISDSEKNELFQNLLEETKSYDEKNRHAVSRLNSEYENLSQNFQGKVQDVQTIYSQMQNLHLFDKKRFFEDMKASVNPELRDLYKKRYLLNSYRINHNELVHNSNQNTFSDIISNVFKKFKTSSTPLMLGPHFERDLPTNDNTPNVEEIDKNLVKALSSFYSNNVLNNKFEFEGYLTDYFKKHYKDITGSHSDTFFNNFVKHSQNNEGLNFEEGDLFKIAKFYEIDTSNLQNQINSNLVVRDGLIYENNSNGLNVIYATDKAINGFATDLYGAFLYHKHLAEENNLLANKLSTLQNNFIEYANKNGIDIQNTFIANPVSKRFVKKKNSKDNIVDFKSQNI